MRTLPAIRIPENDLDCFSNLKAEIRHEIVMWQEVFKFIAEHRSENAGIKAAAKRWKLVKGFSYGTIRRKFYEFKKEGWTSLINGSKTTRPTTANNLLPIFKDYALSNQRSSKEGWRRMMLEFARGEYFPDVGDWRMVWSEQKPESPVPTEFPHGWIPHGWKYENLMRKADLTDYDVTLRRKGRAAAREFLLPVLSTRVGTEVGEFYMFDDVWHDCSINAIGVNRKAQREIEFCCIDVLSGHKIAYGMQPRIYDPETGKRNNVAGGRMLELMAFVLCYRGYRPAGTKMIIEHGTASLPPEKQKLITEMTGGAVTFTAGGIISAQMHKGLYPGQSRGNFKLKASLESQHGISHNVAAYLPGQLGKDPDSSPEENYGLDLHNTHLLTCFEELMRTAPDRAKLLAYDIQTDYEYRQAIDSLYHIVATRPDHNLEGFEKAGLVTTEFRVSESSGQWIPQERLKEFPEMERNAIRALMRSNPQVYTRSRKLSRLEAWERGESKLVKLTRYAMPLILGPELARPVTILPTGLFEFRNKDYGPETFIYNGLEVVNYEGFKFSLKRDKAYIIHANPFNLDEVFVSDKETGAVLGIAPRYGVPCKNDFESLTRQIGYQSKIEHQLMKPHIEADSQRKRMQTRIKNQQQNIRVLSKQPITDAELDAHNRIKAEKGSIEDIFSAPVDLPELETEPEGLGSIY
jgi:hypothetical protein